MASWNAELEAIFLANEEVMDVAEDAMEDEACSSDDVSTVTIIIKDVLEGLQEVRGFHPLPPELHEQEVWNKLLALGINECIIMASTKNVSKEKSWLAFHEKVQGIGSHFIDLIDERVAIFLATCIFDACLRRIWPENNQVVGLLESEVSVEDYDVISYIGGSVISKLKFKARGTYLKCIQLLECSQEEAVHATLIHTKDRGGLTFIGERTFDVFKKAEGLFKKLNKQEKVDQATFVAQCYDLLKDDFFSIFLNEEQIYPASVIEKVLHDLIVKYHKIRIHHHGKVIMQKLSSKRQSAFRKTLSK